MPRTRLINKKDRDSKAEVDYKPESELSSYESGDVELVEVEVSYFIYD